MFMPWLKCLAAATTHAQAGRFKEFLAKCQQIFDTHQSSPEAVLNVGVLLLDFGYLALAKQCFERLATIAPADFRAQMNLANVARERGDHVECRRLYERLQKSHPNNQAVRRNALLSLEYGPTVSDRERYSRALSWGSWALSEAGGPRPRPNVFPLVGRPLRIGYVSADFCQHTVGLFVKDILAAHSPERVLAYAYSAGKVDDWVTETIRKTCQYRDVASLNDRALAARIREDQIDVLVDLSGHTAGSRLTVFAHRPAPVLVSWLGYFATTGLPTVDAVLLDEWSAPEGTESVFTETIVRLPGGRFCYTPAPWAPEVAPLPCLTRGHITFGCFNNTAKLNPEVYALWAKILLAVPDSSLVLKWRTFQDEALCQAVRDTFHKLGITPARLELRGASFHVDLLKEYADIDITLDPFPFTGGLTSCEALWMGAPVVTWPQSRVASRQTYGYLSAIDLPELAARDAEEYVRIAVDLADDRGRLDAMRQTLRAKMQASSLMDVTGFTRQLEQTLIDLYRDISSQEADRHMPTRKTLLNVGAGHPKSGASIPAGFSTPGWREVRLDIDPANEPDILGAMLDMSAVADESVDAIYSAHSIEHLYPNEIPAALREFLRVLRPEGFLVVNCPDLQAAAQMVAEDKLMEVAYTSPAGPVTPFDMIYSHRKFTGRDKPFMAHHCGFTLTALLGTLQANGFASVAGLRRLTCFDIWALASKEPLTDEALRALAGKFLPDCSKQG
jgi:predicted O-linked N-acetylglucosamine transferase (SPINDLY family)